ncbi:hypothetical protein Cs308_0637 [Candidatus Chlamydia sanziniae]|uniref:Uncharacterized protein n=1 Tax=Candidatus Chlamydia sanziniae TaxID=1806891 RepID=A0A1A9HVS9_9CHLA|nr:hypothetical protein Cs308_0637 [Candidatus Chlamydia sanziniae]
MVPEISFTLLPCYLCYLLKIVFAGWIRRLFPSLPVLALGVN